MSEVLIGTSAYANADAKLLKEAGIAWVRQGFPYPFKDRLEGELSDEFRKAKAQAEAWAAKGFKIMGHTPLIGIGTQKPDAQGRLALTWTDRYPAYMGRLGAEGFCHNYEAICGRLARELRGLVAMWQVLNEMDISIFAGPLSPRQSCELIIHGARGLKAADPDLMVGTNTAGVPKAYYIYGRLHFLARVRLDYCGVDAYYGTWEAGGPERWSERIAELYELTQTKVLVNEWGYSSAGELMSPQQQASGAYVCQHKRWRHAWGGGHTPEVQAEYVGAAFEAFRARREMLLGAFFYRWEDQEKCWQCGAPDCPAETAWGLVTRENKPKPAFNAFKNGVARL